MTSVKPSRKLKKELALLGVYALAVGATLSSGFFLLPGLAAEEAGPAVVLAYLIALLPLIPGIMSKMELSTAMPRAGGEYYFLDRSIGPLFGTIGGLGTWLALILKVAFALVGIGAYIHLVWTDAPFQLLAVGFAIVFGIINLFGTKGSGGFQVVMVMGLLLVLVVFGAIGVPKIETSNFDNFFGKGPKAILSTAGLVCISYIGLTKVSSMSEEVKNPERNLPLGMFLAVLTAIAVYLIGTTVMVGVLGENLYSVEHHLTPVAATAEAAVGRWGLIAMTVAAVLAFFSVANAGIMSASRYPLAMSRDQLMPSVFQKLSKYNTPSSSIILTVGLIIMVILVFEPLKIAKLAGAFQLLLFAGNCISVIIMRESRIPSYDPGYKVPFYPWIQIIGIIAPFILIVAMGWLPIIFSSGLIVIGIIWFFVYGKPRVSRHGAIYYLFSRLGEKRFYDLDRELRTILKEKGLRKEDPFDEVVARAPVVDLDECTFEDAAERASELLAERLPMSAADLFSGFLEGTRTGATPVTGGIALPHMRIAGVEIPEMVIVRIKSGLHIDAPGVASNEEGGSKTFAAFFLVSAENDPGQHLRILAQLATRVDEQGFLESWLEAGDEQRLREILLRDEHFVSITLESDSNASSYIGRAIKDLNLPTGCLVALIRHEDGEIIVPRGSTVLSEGDRLTVLGELRALEQLRVDLGVDM